MRFPGHGVTCARKGIFISMAPSDISNRRPLATPTPRGRTAGGRRDHAACRRSCLVPVRDAVQAQPHQPFRAGNGRWVAADRRRDQYRGYRSQWDAILPQLTARRPIAGIIVTHHHGDHIGHAGPLADRTGAPILMSRAEHDMARQALSMSDDRLWRDDRGRLSQLRSS